MELGGEEHQKLHRLTPVQTFLDEVDPRLRFVHRILETLLVHKTGDLWC